MLSTVARHLRQLMDNSEMNDAFLLNNQTISFDRSSFQLISLPSAASQKTVAFVDGGQAEIASAANFTISFIRVFAQTFRGKEKINAKKAEFFLLTYALPHANDLWYQSVIFSQEEQLFSPKLLFVSSNDPLLKEGKERAPCSKIVSMARRFAELALASQLDTDFVVLDGTLDASYPHEEELLQRLGKNCSAVAKSSTLLTASGNSSTLLLHRHGPREPWVYPIDEVTSFVKLHPQAKHVFRFEGNQDVLPYLLLHSADAVFLGYPYGLLFADWLARVSNHEKKALSLRFLLDKENKGIVDYLTTLNAHAILDTIG